MSTAESVEGSLGFVKSVGGGEGAVVFVRNGKAKVGAEIGQLAF